MLRGSKVEMANGRTKAQNGSDEAQTPIEGGSEPGFAARMQRARSRARRYHCDAGVGGHRAKARHFQSASLPSLTSRQRVGGPPSSHDPVLPPARPAIEEQPVGTFDFASENLPSFSGGKMQFASPGKRLESRFIPGNDRQSAILRSLVHTGQ